MLDGHVTEALVLACWLFGWGWLGLDMVGLGLE